MDKLIALDHPWVDSSRAPLYVMSFPPRAADGDLVGMCAAREAWAKVAKYPVAWVVDLSHILEVTAKQRRMFGDHLERFEAHDVVYNRGSALIVPNTFLRGIVTAIFWIKPPRFPNELFATRGEAFAWAERQLFGPSLTQQP